MLAQLCIQQSKRQPGSDQLQVTALAKQVRNRADVVFMTMGQYEGVDGVESAPDRLEVGQDQVDAGMVVFWEEHSTVDDEQPAGVLEDRHVAADLAEAA
jgi:hypothetical protein